MNIKVLIESCIDDLMNNQPISKTFLKVQTISFYLKNDQFYKWFNNEKDGYKSAKNLPEYRKTKCQVFANINNPYKGLYTNYHIPVDQVKNDMIKEFLANCSFCESIIELENLAQTQEEGSIRKYVPGFAHSEIQKLFSQGYYIDAAWQTVSKFTVVSIVESVKSKLLQFFLEMNEQFNNDINFDVMTKKKEIDKIVNQTINTSIYVNEGSANIANSTLMGGHDNSVHINADMKSVIEKILSQIEIVANKLSDEQDEITDEIARIKTQLNKAEPKTGILKSAFQTIHGILVSVTGNVVTPDILTGIQSVLTMIGG
jgi:hypothetical protein